MRISLVFQQIIFRIVIMVSSMEDAHNAPHLDAHMMDEALPYRLLSYRAIARDRAGLTTVEESYPPKLLQ